MRSSVSAVLILLGTLAQPGWAQTTPAAPPANKGTPPARTEAARLEADQLVYDSQSDRIIARGSAKFYFNAYILSGDKLIYDQQSNRFLAEGNAQLNDPNGSITRADRFEALDDFRDAFVAAVCRRGVALVSLAVCNR